MFHSVRHEIVDYFFEFVRIHKHRPSVHIVRYFQKYAFLCTIVFEWSYIIPENSGNVTTAQAEIQGICLQFAEVHNLIHKLQHTVDAIPDSRNETAVIRRVLQLFSNLCHGSENQSERRPELMRHIGEV